MTTEPLWQDEQVLPRRGDCARRLPANKARHAVLAARRLVLRAPDPPPPLLPEGGGAGLKLRRHRPLSERTEPRLNWAGALRTHGAGRRGGGRLPTI